MSKGNVANKAADNSRRFNAGSFNYSSVDGNVYNVERDRTARINPEHYSSPIGRPGAGMPSMIEIYRCEYFLTKGTRYTKSAVPANEKDRIIQEYNLVFYPQGNQYINSIENVWNVLVSKYGVILQNKRITSYNELVYRSKYR